MLELEKLKSLRQEFMHGATQPRTRRRKEGALALLPGTEFQAFSKCKGFFFFIFIFYFLFFRSSRAATGTNSNHHIRLPSSIAALPQRANSPEAQDNTFQMNFHLQS